MVSTGNILTAPAHQDENARGLSRGQRHLIWIFYLLASAACSYYNYITQRPFLGDPLIDGFASQVHFIWNIWNSGGAFFELEPLLWIHAIRALIAYIFILLEDLGGPALVSVIVLTLSIPLVNKFCTLKRGYIIIFLPVLLTITSSRTFLVIMSTSYLFLFFKAKAKTNKLYLPISFILANLSSGAVLNNLIISIFLGRKYQGRSLLFSTYIFLLFCSFYISATDKFYGFSEQKVGYDATVYGTSTLGAALSRNTLFVSALVGNTDRLVAYGIVISVAFGLFFLAIKRQEYRGYVVVLAAVVPSLLFEGLGFMSLLGPILLFAAGDRMPWRPEIRHG